MKSHPYRKKLTTALKLAFVFALLYFLVKKGFVSVDATLRAFSSPHLMIPAIIGLLATITLAVLRWRWLLEAHGIQLTYVRTWQLTMIGNFFNIALPGAVSGDFVKAFYVANEVQAQRSRAFGSILFDRVSGLSALVMVSAGALLLDWNQLYGTPLFNAVRVMILTAAAGFVGFYLYLFLVREHHDPVLRLFKILEAKASKMGAITRIYLSLRHYHSHRWAVAKALLASIVIHCMVCYSCTLFAQALGDPNLSRAAVFVIVPLGLLVTAVPIMPAGVGTGHAAFGYLFQFLGAARGADVFSLFALNQLFIGALGGLIYLRFKSTHSAQSSQEIAHDRNPSHDALSVSKAGALQARD